MTKIYFLLVVLFLGAGSQSIAQKKLEPGYVILANGERIEGFIKYQDRESNPEKVVFSTTEGGEKKTYFPLDLQSFGVADERFLSRILETEISPRKTGELTYASDLKIRMDTVFLRVLIQGGKNLYHLRNDSWIDNFYIGEGEDIALLGYKPYLENGRKLMDNIAYKSQLEKFLKECPNRMELIEETEYNLSDLEDLFLDYYECVGSEFDFHHPRQKMKVQFGVVAGMTHTKIKISHSDPLLSSISFPSSLTPTGGVFLDALIPRSGYRWSIYNELHFSSFKTGVDYAGRIPSVFSPSGRTDLDYAYLVLNNMIRYTVPVGPVKLFANAGISNGVALKAEDNEDVLIPVKRRHEQSLLIGGGVGYGRFSLEGRFQRGNGMSTVRSLRTPTNRIHVLAGFRF